MRSPEASPRWHLLHTTANGGFPAAGGRQLAPASNPGHLVEDTVKHIKDIDQGALTYAEPPQMVVARKRSAGWRAIWETFKEYFSLLLQRIKDIPGRLVARAEHKISNQFFGPDGAHQFGFGVADVDKRAALVVELREQLAHQPDSSLGAQARVAERARGTRA